MLGRGQVHFDVLMQWVHILRAEHWPGPTFTHRDLYPAEGRNVVSAGALLRKDWGKLLWVDSDQLPSPAFLQRLREYPKSAKLVIGTYFGREYPFDLQAWNSNPESEGLLAIHPAQIDEMMATPGLYPVGGGGTGWMLIDREVLEAMEALKGPGYIWEIKGITPELAAKLGVGLVIGEDVSFCIETHRHLGVQAFLDTDPRIESAHLSVQRIGRREWYAAHVLGLPQQGPAKAQLDVEALNRSGHRLEVEVDPERLQEATEMAARRRPSPAREGEYVPDGEAIDWQALREASERRRQAQP